MSIERILAKNLQRGMVVVNLDTGRRRTVLTDAMLTRAPGYVRAETTDRANPVNCHGSTELHVEVNE